MISPDRLEAAYQTALAALLKERTPQGHWIGELSTSALSTATAVMALFLVQKHAGAAHQPLIDGGLAWLAEHQNEDGGWGDTTISISNISTTMLCRSAFYLTGMRERRQANIERTERWLTENYGPESKWPEAVRQRYGKDRTFATPILTTCALAGLVSWDEVPPLPFELACLPQSWFRFVKLHVVSYALPALIAIGQCIEYHKKSRNPIVRAVRALSRKRALKVLLAIQPTSGGYLEAIPLTSFVTLSLAASELAQHPVSTKAIEFLVQSVRPDGSWAIDSNLATWVTTLSINALAAAGEFDRLSEEKAVGEWLLKQQYRKRHPYTGAEPGGWAWTDLPGGVPDGDDTPGAILALRNLWFALDKAHRITDRTRKEFEKQLQTAFPSHLALFGGFGGEASAACLWLLDLQNRDGGWPTFCRGWGHLPFDRSGNDLTAHVLRSIFICLPLLEQDVHMPDFSNPNRRLAIMSGDYYYKKCGQAIQKGIAYLARAQRPDGSWLPLWFGNQHAPDDENPTYGTARVLAAYRDLHMMDTEPARKGIGWLLQNQNPDGGWGGGPAKPQAAMQGGTASSIEESALALDVLVDAGAENADAVNKGLAWLVEKVELGGLSHPTPIGFYFAKLWYFEKLYPIIFTVAALGRARRGLQDQS